MDPDYRVTGLGDASLNCPVSGPCHGEGLSNQGRTGFLARIAQREIRRLASGRQRIKPIYSG